MQRAASDAGPTSYLQIALTQSSLFNASCQARPGFDAALHVSDAGGVVESNQGFVHDGFSAVPRLRVSMCCKKSDGEGEERHRVDERAVLARRAGSLAPHAIRGPDLLAARYSRQRTRQRRLLAHAFG